MNDEIKEILNYYRNIVNDKKETYTVVSRDTIYLEQLLDYITNLQEKIKHYEETTTFGDYVKEVNLLLDYKSRIDKAIEYIKENEGVDLYDDVGSEFIRNLLNILRGEDK